MNYAYHSNTVVAAIRVQAGNMGYATSHVFVSATSGGTSSTSSYAYDAAGCLTNLNGVSLEWDERYRLVEVDDASSFVAYEYDVLGRRTARMSGSETNYFIYNGSQVAADLDGSGNLQRTYVWGTGIDNLLSFTDHVSSNTYYSIKDHQNSVIALVDETGAVVESYEYTAYGEILDVKDASGNSIGDQQSAIGNRYTFQGREIDWTTGLIYFRARWYDPDSGRWLSKDPIGISGGLNLYAFCGNNPVNRVDPDGLDYIDATGNAFGGFAQTYGGAWVGSAGMVTYGLGAIFGSEGMKDAGSGMMDKSSDLIKNGLDKMGKGIDEYSKYPEPPSRWTDKLPWSPEYKKDDC